MHHRTYPRRRFLQLALGAAGGIGASLPRATRRVDAATASVPTFPADGTKIQRPFAANLAVVGRRDQYGRIRYGYIDRTGNVAIPFQFLNVGSFSEAGLALIVLDERWGFIDTHGAFVIGPQVFAKEFASIGIAAVMDDQQRWGFINTTGTEIIPPQFDTTAGFIELQIEGQSRLLPPLPPFAPVTLGSDSFYIDTTGTRVWHESYEKAESFSAEGFASVRVGRLWGVIDRSGTMVVPPQYVEAPTFVSEEFSTYSEGRAKVGLLHVPTNTRIPLASDYTYLKTMSAGRIVSYLNSTAAKSGNVYLDRTGAVAIPGPFEFSDTFVDGVAAVQDGSGAYFITPDGANAFGRTFTRTWSFSNGLAQFAQGDRAGFIDRTGAVVIPPQFYY